jgi:hypothetical protein
MVYSERVKTTSIYVRDSTNISDYALLLFGGNLVASKNGEGIEMLRGYLHFSASKSVLDLIQVTFLNRFPLSLCFLFIIYIKVNTILFGVSAETEGRTRQASE